MIFLTTGSTRDIQKKLAALLPKDYSKEYRKFRPANSRNARIRLRHIKSCGDYRIRKAFKPKCKSVINIQANNQSERTQPSGNLHQNPASAFIDYSKPPSYPSSYITPDLLNSWREEHDAFESETIAALSEVSSPVVADNFGTGELSAPSIAGGSSTRNRYVLFPPIVNNASKQRVLEARNTECTHHIRNEPLLDTNEGKAF
jgi:hypothetical protein